MSTLSLAPSFTTSAPVRSTVRLTRRGRLVVFVTSLFLVLAVAGIASELATDGDVRSMMTEIERLNALESASLSAGQKLRVPVVSD